MNKTLQFRQGDVFIMRVDSVPTNAKPVDRENGKIVLAHGEVTGHAHTINDTVTDPFASLFATEDAVYLSVDNEVAVVHQEHDAITLPAGNYQVRRQREYTPQEIRNVMD